MTKRAEYFAMLQKTLAWTAAYKPEDVAAICSGKPVKGSSQVASTDAAALAPAVPDGPTGCKATVPPIEGFPIGNAYEEFELMREFSRSCPGGRIDKNGGISVVWDAKEYVVQTVKHREPNGLMIYEITSVRAR
jgi:hypothetical protein